MSAHLERLFRIYNRLRRGPVTIEIISNWARTAGINVSERQLYRDLNQLKSLQLAEGENLVEYTDEKNRKTWKLEYKEASEKLTRYDINSWFLLKSFAPYAVLEQRKSSIDKFEHVLYKTLSKNKFQHSVQANELYLRRTKYMDNKFGEVEHQQMEDLIWALHNQKVVIIESDLINAANNHLPPEAFPVRMFPLELIFHRGRVHIGGLAPDHNQLLIYPMDRNLVFRLTNDTFSRKKYEKAYARKIEPYFGISTPMDNKVYHIKVEFTRGFAESFMNFFWHDSQQWKPLKNGNYMLHLHCGIGRELLGFIALGLDMVKVHAPKVLKDMVVKKMQVTADIHRQDLPLNEAIANSDYKR